MHKGSTLMNTGPSTGNGIMNPEQAVPGFGTRLWMWFRRTFDTSCPLAPVPEEKLDRMDLMRCYPFLIMHVACLAVIGVGVSGVAVGVAAGLYAVRMFAITAFYHRYFSHRAFKTSRFCQFIFAVIGNSAGQRGPLWWAAHHRHHHRNSDKENDVHSPHQKGFLWSHMLWFLARRHYQTDVQSVKDLAAFPELRLMDRFDSFLPIGLGGALYGLGVALNALWPGLGTNGLQMLVWGFCVSTVVLFHATVTINSLSHVWGRQRFATTDESRNNLFLALLTFGEGWHNNHHFYPGSARQGFHWWEIDISYYVLKIMARLGLVWDLNPVPEQVFQSPRRLDVAQPRDGLDATAGIPAGEPAQFPAG